MEYRTSENVTPVENESEATTDANIVKSCKISFTFAKEVPCLISNKIASPFALFCQCEQGLSLKLRKRWLRLNSLILLSAWFSYM